MYNSEMEIRDIMAMSGHKTEAMFLRYINKSNDQHLERAREIMERELN